MSLFSTAVAISGQPSKWSHSRAEHYLPSMSITQNYQESLQKSLMIQIIPYFIAFKATSVIFTPQMQISEKHGFKRNKKALNNEELWRSDQLYCEAAVLCFLNRYLQECFLIRTSAEAQYCMNRLYLTKSTVRWGYLATGERIGGHQMLDYAFSLLDLIEPSTQSQTSQSSMKMSLNLHAKAPIHLFCEVTKGSPFILNEVKLELLTFAYDISC